MTPHILDVTKLMDIAREQISTTEGEPFSDEMAEMVVGVMVSMYIKGYKDGLRSVDLSNSFMLKDVERAVEEVKTLYAIKQ